MTQRIGIYRNDNEHLDFDAESDLKSGQLLEVLGKVGIICGEGEYKTGDRVTAKFNCRAEILKTDPSTVYAKGDAINYKTDTLRADATGSLVAGKAAMPSAAGDPYVMVMLNF